ncbi:hypothetical protein FRC11_013458, partial [Ceratobasidium sp. 423]
MEELLNASKLLRASLDRYISACTAVTASYDPNNERDSSDPPLKCIKNELRTIADYEKDIQDAKAMLGRSRNSSTTLVPISVLPIDILEWVFELVYHSWLRTADFEIIDTDRDEYEEEYVDPDYIQYYMDIKRPPPMFPEALTHVCAHWRRVALGSHKLWRRIDLPIFSRSYNWLSRGETFASRVAPPKLDVHILMANDDMEESEWIYSRVDQFCASVSSRIQSLQLTNGVKERPGSLTSNLSPLLDASFAHLVPGTLSHLALLDHYPPWHMFIESAELVRGSRRSSDTISIGVPTQRMDEILRPITSLWLKNHFFPWESPAYYGLVDLRLLSSGRHALPSIKPSQLTNILSSCPKLRIFHWDIEVRGTDQQNAIGSVYLAELEDLNIRQMKHNHHEYFLPLVSPGPKPLSLSIRSTPHLAQGLFTTAVSNFFNRSNVTALYIQGDYDSLPLEKLVLGLPVD